MTKKHLLTLLIASFIPIMMLNACASGNNDAPAEAVEAYLEALSNKDVNGMIEHSCATWEEDAKVELNSFTAVSIKLENLNCQVTGNDNVYTLVTCDGQIVAGYGNEDLAIELNEKTFQVIKENDDWRMCGYHK